MKTVKTFGNLAEAGVASSLLEAKGIRTALLDEQSFSLNPGLAAHGIRLQVVEADIDRATQVLTGMDVEPREEPLLSQDDAGTAETARRIPLGLFAALAIGLVLLFMATRGMRDHQRDGAYSSVEFDYNRDGKPDYFVTYLNGTYVSARADRNSDGQIDEWEEFDSEGLPAKSQYDNNFDGRPDLWTTSRDGLPQVSQLDANFDGKPDTVISYKHGITISSELLPNDAGHVLRKWFHQAGIIREEWVDEDDDGSFDFKYLYDPFGKRSEALPIP